MLGLSEPPTISRPRPSPTGGPSAAWSHDAPGRQIAGPGRAVPSGAAWDGPRAPGSAGICACADILPGSCAQGTAASPAKEVARDSPPDHTQEGTMRPQLTLSQIGQISVSVKDVEIGRASCRERGE